MLHARRSPVALLAAALLLLQLATAARGAEPAQRVVSMNPSLTAILLALGARDVLVGVDDWSARLSPEVASLPRVGGLYSPSLEAVVALRPDLVAIVTSVEQRDFRDRLAALDIPVCVFENIAFDEVLQNIVRLGELVGRSQVAQERVAAIRRARRAAAERSAGRPHPRSLLVVQRDPLFVVGRGSFLDELLRAAGADNLGARFDEPYPRVAAEWVLAAAPEVILDASADAQDAAEWWSRWPSLPAVEQGRVVRLRQEVTLPGPDLDRSLRELAAALRGPTVP
jgi:iron complex transport system substrate-binding protein